MAKAVRRLASAGSTHTYVDMKFPSKSAREKNEKVKCVVANVFLCRFVMYPLATNLVLIAFGADVFFWVAGIKACGPDFDRAVFWLFGNTDIHVTEAVQSGLSAVKPPII